MKYFAISVVLIGLVALAASACAARYNKTLYFIGSNRGR